jgi:hypothetical protein
VHRAAKEANKLHPVVNPSELAQWTTPFMRCARGSPTWGLRHTGNSDRRHRLSYPAPNLQLGMARLPPNSWQTHSSSDYHGHYLAGIWRAPHWGKPGYHQHEHYRILLSLQVRRLHWNHQRRRIVPPMRPATMEWKPDDACTRSTPPL